MGCCASDRSNQNLNQQRALQQQFIAANYHNQQMATSTQFGKPFQLQFPRQGHKYYKKAIQVRAAEVNQHQLTVNKAARAGFLTNQPQEGYKNDNKMIQSPINVVCSSDPRQHSQGFSQLQGMNISHQLHSAHLIAQNPSSRKLDFIKASISSSNNPKLEENLKLPGNFSPKLHHENQSKVMGQGNVNENSNGQKLNGRDLQLKVHGEQQVLQTYQQYFELPIFEVALAVH